MTAHTSSTPFYRNPLRGWFVFFFLVQLGFAMPFSTNPKSRWTMLSALAEDGSPRIDAYYKASVDWARTPDGHYYSNKAPGPALLGAPLFAFLDAWQTRGISSREERDRVRRDMGGSNLRLLSFVFQIVPFFLLTLLMLRHLTKSGASRGARSAATIALLFGNTACLFLNQYFGHGCAAVCALALYLAVLQGRVGLSAFFFGLGALCEYSGALLLIPLLPFWIDSLRRSTHRAQWVGKFFAGAALPAVVWIAYHTYCFGGPFSIPNQFQNPAFVEQTADRANLWGIFFFPSLEAVWGLTLGWSRGLFFTQPWVLLLLVSLFAVPTLRREVFAARHRGDLALPLLFFVLLFMMNSSFNGWHGGSTAGPRYLSSGLVLLAPVLGLVWDRFPPRLQRLAWVLIGLSVFLQILFLSVDTALPKSGVPLWRFYFDQLAGPNWHTPALRLAIGISLALALFYWTWSGRLKESGYQSKAAFPPAGPR